MSVDILVRDNSTKQLKYMNLSVDSVKVDAYDSESGSKSIIYNRQKIFGNRTDQDYLTLFNFNTMPSTTLSGVIKNNEIVNITDNNTWILTKTYNPTASRMDLTYNKL